MRAVVALVETGPETIIEDYARVMDLAGLARGSGEDPWALVPVARSGSWLPGAGTPPWQLDGVLAWLDKVAASGSMASRERVPVVHPVSVGKSAATAEAWSWADVLARRGAEIASAHFRSTRAFRPEPGLPDLEAALSQGLMMPNGLRERATLLLPVPVLGSEILLRGAVDLLTGLLAAGLSTTAKVGNLAARGDVLRFANQALPWLGVVMDAVLWQVGPRPGTSPVVARNILLAGRDPVAVDATAVRLAGRDPERDAWFRLCRDQDLGAVRTGDIRLKGHTELLGRDFGVPAGFTEKGALDWARRPLDLVMEKAFRQSAQVKRFARTPWGRLYDDYRAGGPAGE